MYPCKNNREQAIGEPVSAWKYFPPAKVLADVFGPTFRPKKSTGAAKAPFRDGVAIALAKQVRSRSTFFPCSYYLLFLFLFSFLLFFFFSFLLFFFLFFPLFFPFFLMFFSLFLLLLPFLSSISFSRLLVLFFSCPVSVSFSSSLVFCRQSLPRPFVS